MSLYKIIELGIIDVFNNSSKGGVHPLCKSQLKLCLYRHNEIVCL